MTDTHSIAQPFEAEVSPANNRQLTVSYASRYPDYNRIPAITLKGQWLEAAGFTTGTPWIEVNPNYTAINAAAEEKDPDSVLNYYKQMIALRKSHLGLIYGSFQLLAEENPQVFAYRRTLAETGENYLIACNFSDKDAAFTIPADFAGARRLIGNYHDTAPTGAVTLRPYEAFVLQK